MEYGPKGNKTSTPWEQCDGLKMPNDNVAKNTSTSTSAKTLTNIPTLNETEETHYTVLGVRKDDTLSTIKAAHRILALQYHPDKQMEDTNDNNRDCNITTEERFLKIQAAWECLRNEDSRSLYDDSLRRLLEKSQTSIHKAKRVLLSEMNCEICDVESDLNVNGNERGADDQGSLVEQQNLYTFQCRCGYEFEILEDELQFDCTKRVATLNVWECQNCSLAINVITDSLEKS
jgi:DnaJ-class molecular chaperone